MAREAHARSSEDVIGRYAAGVWGAGRARRAWESAQVGVNCAVRAAPPLWGSEWAVRGHVEAHRASLSRISGPAGRASGGWRRTHLTNVELYRHSVPEGGRRAFQRRRRGPRTAMLDPVGPGMRFPVHVPMLPGNARQARR